MIVIANKKITIKEVAEEIGIAYGSCEAIFKNIFDMKRVAAKFVPKLLNFIIYRFAYQIICGKT